MELTYDQFITDYRNFLTKVSVGSSGEVPIFGISPKMQMTSAQTEVWRRVKDTELGDEVSFGHCEVCTEEWRDDIRRSIRLIDEYLSGNLSEVVYGVVAVYRSGQEGVTVVIYDDGQRVWVGQSTHEVVDEVRKFLAKNRGVPGKAINAKVLPTHIDNFTLESVSRSQTLFSSEI